MQDKTKNIIITIGFAVILIAVFVINLISKDKEISITERRRLAQFPKINIESVNNGNASKNLDKYVTDQFTGRDIFRNIKSFISVNILKQKDNNNLFEKNGTIYKMEYPLNNENLQRSLSKINNVYNKYLQGMNVYYAIIPEKNYYLENDDHLKIDYKEVEAIAKSNLPQMKYIDISEGLSLKDYYKTDLHWKQENLRGVVNLIEKGMNLTDTSKTNYTINEVGDFYGAYYGQLGIDIAPDKLYTMDNETLDNCTVYNYETQTTGNVYTTSKTADKYDTYLNGATPLLTIQNPSAKTEKELLLFRDSFGSSLAPLLVENYSKITLIDLRYMSSEILGKYVDFNNQDVLFLYSTLVLNQNILK